MSYCGNCGAEILEKEKETHCYECGMVICDKCSKRHPAKFGEPCYFAVKKNVNDVAVLSGLFYSVIHVETAFQISHIMLKWLHFLRGAQRRLKSR